MNAGDKVVCVDDDWSKSWDDPHKWFNHVPERGRVYVVAQWSTATNGEKMICLVGVNSQPNGGGFYPNRFRLLSEIKKQNENHSINKRAISHR